MAEDQKMTETEERELVELYSLPNSTTIAFLDCAKPWAQLSENEKLYCHHIGAASWQGAPINLFQTSPESPGIFRLLQMVFSAQPVDDLVKAAKASDALEETDVDAIMVYAAGFYGNVGNYVSFGDTKIIPRVAPEKFLAFLKCSKADPEKWGALWEACNERMYSLAPRHRQLGIGEENGISTYYTPDVTMEDCKKVASFMEAKKISPYNTRLFKKGPGSFEIRQASAKTGTVLEEEKWEDMTISVVRGDYAGLMARICHHLTEAGKYASNDTQKKMMEKYVDSFSGGSIDDHKLASKHWVKDTGPVVESYIGFIESYQDPFGARGEWEGFSAVVDKETSKKFGTLVDGAPGLLKLMPWPAELEKDVFKRPDFTSLEIVSFGSSGVPAGINIPNYDDIRQNFGFKNVSLGNVLRSRSKKEKVQYIKDDDQQMYQDLIDESFEVQVGLHELLGHGSGKLFMEAEDGTLNFPKGLKNPDTGEPVTKWYKPGQTYDSVFAEMSSPLEECRAEAVGIYLCTEPSVHKVFGLEDKQKAADVAYVNWLSMARKGVLGLRFYTPETGKWRQAHMQARYVLLQVMLEAGEGFVKVEEVKNEEDGEPDLLVTMDRTKIETVGRKCVGDFLLKIMALKATADADGARKLFQEGYSSVNEQFLKFREITNKRRKPRGLKIQAHTYVDKEGKAQISTYPDTAAGMVTSFVDRYRDQMKDGDDPVVAALDEWNRPLVSDGAAVSAL